MNTTHRGLNRTLLALLGLLLIAIGALLAAIEVLPGFATAWTDTGARTWRWVQGQLRAAAIGSVDISWWTVAVLALLVIVAILLVCWIVSQGGGRSSRMGRRQDPNGHGSTVVDSSLAVQEFNDALAGHGQIVASSVQSWHAKGTDGLTITVQARKGASPRELTTTVQELISGLDALLGEEVPVLVRITAGARTRFARTTRVR